MTQKRSVLRRIGKFLSYAVVLVAVILTAAHFVWKYSGSGQWELWRDTSVTPAYTKKGQRMLPVAIYTLKKPGATRVQIKVVTRFHGTMDRAVAVLSDTTTEGCNNFLSGCTAGKLFKPFDERSLNFVQAFRVDTSKYVSWMKDILFVNKTQMTRDPRTRAVTVTVEGVPELIPHDPCCLRMTDLHAVWRFTPLENGMIELQYTRNDDPHMPYFIYNRIMPRAHTSTGRAIERAVNLEKYRNAHYAFLRDPEPQNADLLTATKTEARQN